MRQRRGTDEEVLCKFFERAHQGLWHDQPAQSPTGHAEVFGEAVDDDEVLAEFECGARRAFIGQPEIDFIDQCETAPCPCEGNDAGEFIERNRGAGWVGRRGQQCAAGGRAPVLGQQPFGHLEARVGKDWYGTRYPVEGGNEMPVAGIARIGEQYLIAHAHQRAPAIDGRARSTLSQRGHSHL